MKKLLTSSLLALFVVACGSATVLTYSVEFTTEDTGRMSDLSIATRHIVERRLARLGGNLTNYTVDYDADTNATTITLEVDNAAVAQQLNEEMQSPFTFEVRYAVEDLQEGDIETEGTGNFRASGITKNDIDWVIGESTEPPLTLGRVQIAFTEEGAAKMKELFAEQAGNTIGLFVRDRLTAAVQISGEFEKILVIDGLPNGDIANVFADDLNVGIHMTFTQQ